MPVFEIVVISRPLLASPQFLAEDMLELSNLTELSVRKRISKGVNVSDTPARPLSRGYAKIKTRKGLPAMRNWVFTGQMLGTLGPLEIRDNYAAFGFDWKSSPLFKRANYAQWQERMFGMSPANHMEFAINLDAVFRQRVFPRL